MGEISWIADSLQAAVDQVWSRPKEQAKVDQQTPYSTGEMQIQIALQASDLARGRCSPQGLWCRHRQRLYNNPWLFVMQQHIRQ